MEFIIGGLISAAIVATFILLIRIAKRNEFKMQVEESGFTATKSIETLCVDEVNKKWWIKYSGDMPVFHDYDEILDFELVIDGEKFRSEGGISRAVAGGLLFGGIGALVGASTAKRKSTISRMYINIITKGGYIEKVSFINNVETEVSSGYYNMCKQSAEQAGAILTSMMYEAKNPVDEPVLYAAPQIETAIESNDLNTQVTVSTRFTTVESDSSKYYQRWDESYDKELGYEWFKICTEYINFPEYNTIDRRLVNIRKAQGDTQLSIANCIGISHSTLSAYENGYSVPSGKNLEALANCYNVPVSFIKQGIGSDLISHAKLCKRYGEEQYIKSLGLSIRAASCMFRDLLTVEDIELCIKLDTELNFGIGFAEILEKEKLKKDITDKLIDILSNGDINQKEFYSSLGENRRVGMNVVKDLSANGTISKIPHGSSFMLHLNDTE